jgi:hypothetical protein
MQDGFSNIERISEKQFAGYTGTTESMRKPAPSLTFWG